MPGVDCFTMTSEGLEECVNKNLFSISFIVRLTSDDVFVSGRSVNSFELCGQTKFVSVERVMSKFAIVL